MRIRRCYLDLLAYCPAFKKGLKIRRKGTERDGGYKYTKKGTKREKSYISKKLIECRAYYDMKKRAKRNR